MATTSVRKVLYKINPSEEDPNNYNVSVTYLGGDENQRIAIQLHSLYIDSHGGPLKKLTRTKVEETFKDMPYPADGEDAQVLTIRVYECNYFNHNNTLAAIVGLNKATEIGEIQVPVKKNDRKENTEVIDNNLENVKEKNLERWVSRIEDAMKRERDNKKKVKQPNITEQINDTGVRFSFIIKPPPGTVTKIHKQIIQLIKTTLGKHGHTLAEDGSGPTLVTVVNSSRTQEDIDRDMKAAKLSDSEALEVILLRIVPSLTHNSLKVKEMKGENYKLDLVFLAEQSARKLHECEENMEVCEEFIEYLCRPPQVDFVPPSLLDASNVPPSFFQYKS